MRLLRWLSINVLLIANVIVFYEFHQNLDEYTQTVAEIVSLAQAHAAELNTELQDMQQQLTQIELSGPVSQIENGMQKQVILTQFATLDGSQAPVVDFHPEPEMYPAYTTPDEYWQKLQRYAGTDEYLRLNPQKRQQFLDEGADLIQKLEEVETHFRIDSESLQFIEARLGDEGIGAIESLYTVKKQLAGYVVRGKQYRRELDTMLADPTPLELPKVTSRFPRATDNSSEFYHPALADRQVICDNAGNFLIAIHFVYKTQVGGFPKVSNVEDTINLRTMQSINGSYHYPDYFIQEVYTLIRKSFRDGFLQFQGLTQKDLQLQQFLQLIR